MPADEYFEAKREAAADLAKRVAILEDTGEFKAEVTRYREAVVVHGIRFGGDPHPVYLSKDDTIDLFLAIAKALNSEEWGDD